MEISGAKNSALPLMAATLLTPAKFILENVSNLTDVHTMSSLLSLLGAKIEWVAKHTLSINTSSVDKWRAPYDIVRKMRASICVLGPLLARFKRAEVSYPGGCIIGTRPIDLHLKGLRKLSASIQIRDGYVVAHASELRGTTMYLAGTYGSTVLGTANVMMAATLARGEVTIQGAACEPEIIDLGNFLNKMGARIQGLGSPTLTIQGVKELHGVTHHIISDRIEAGTYLIAGVISRGEVEVQGVNPQFLTCLLDKLEEGGAGVEVKGESVKVKGNSKLKPLEIVTLPYPGFPTDLQAQMTALQSTVDDISVVYERVYPDRFMHLAELLRMGARIMREGPRAIIQGGVELQGAPVMASDLRASAALILAGLAAKGTTSVNRVYHIDRGYERIEEKFSQLGARIRRVRE